MQTIDIRTTQNVTIQYELASLRERIFAFVIDLLIITALYLVVLFVIFTLFGFEVLEAPFIGGLIFGLLPIGGLMSYHLISEMLAQGQSWGKKIMGLRVVRLDGREPTASDYLLRAVFQLVDTLFSGGVVAAILISSTTRRQRLGDMTANTSVIRLRNALSFRLEDILRINSLADYQPQYPGVRQLSEQDMLVIKNAINRYRKYPNEAHQTALEELCTRLQELLQLADLPNDRVEFLKTLLRDYIVLTR